MDKGKKTPKTKFYKGGIGLRCPHCKSETAQERVIQGKTVYICPKCRRALSSS
jgi:DNA-directed RNA polymerase subunit RPC12/RpoP